LKLFLMEDDFSERLLSCREKVTAMTVIRVESTVLILFFMMSIISYCQFGKNAMG
jgi:hypothetical protein